MRLRVPIVSRIFPSPPAFFCDLNYFRGFEAEIVILIYTFFFPNSSLTGTAECVNLEGVVRLDFYKPLTLNLDFFLVIFLPEDVNKSFRQQPR